MRAFFQKLRQPRVEAAESKPSAPPSPEERKARRQLDGLRLQQRQADILHALPGLHWLVALLLILAVGATVLTAGKLKAVVGMAKTNEAADVQAAIHLNKTPLTEVEYLSITQWYARIYPTITFKYDKREDALLVSAMQGDHHADWLYAMAALQARDDSVLWSAELFCVGRCDGAAATATIKGYRQRVSHEN